MDATLIVIDSDAELARGRALVDQLMTSDDPVDISRLRAQARLIAAYEEERSPRRLPSTAEVIRYLMDQHGITRKDLVPLLGTPSRVSEILAGKKALSIAMVRRLRARFRVPADLLLPLATIPAAASVRKSITPDYLVCLEDGKKLKMLKRHLRLSYNLTPDGYRKKWGLAPDYPMVAPKYSARRAALAKKIGLGRSMSTSRRRTRIARSDKN